MNKIFTDTELKEFLEHIDCAVRLQNPRVFLTATQKTLLSLDYDFEWVNGAFVSLYEEFFKQKDIRYFSNISHIKEEVLNEILSQFPHSFYLVDLRRDISDFLDGYTLNDTKDAYIYRESDNTPFFVPKPDLTIEEYEFYTGLDADIDYAIWGGDYD